MGARRVEGKGRRKERRRDGKGEKSWVREQLVVKGKK